MKKSTFKIPSETPETATLFIGIIHTWFITLHWWCWNEFWNIVTTPTLLAVFKSEIWIAFHGYFKYFLKLIFDICYRILTIIFIVFEVPSLYKNCGSSPKSRFPFLPRILSYHSGLACQGNLLYKTHQDNLELLSRDSKHWTHHKFELTLRNMGHYTFPTMPTQNRLLAYYHIGIRMTLQVQQSQTLLNHKLQGIFEPSSFHSPRNTQWGLDFEDRWKYIDHKNLKMLNSWKSRVGIIVIIYLLR